MNGPLSLDAYLIDAWLASHTDEPFLHRLPEAERSASLRYLEAQPTWWQDVVSTHVQQLPKLPADTRLFVFMIAGNEKDLIEQCMSALSMDLVASGLQDEAEIVVVRQHRTGQPVDDTSERVRFWAARHRHMVVVSLIDVEWPEDCSTFLSLSRKLAVDVTVQRIAAKPRTAACYFLTEDADVEWIERGRARAVVDMLDAHPRLDALRGWHLRSLGLLEYLPLFVERVSWRAVEYALSRPEFRAEHNPSYNFSWNRVVTAGWNVAFTLEAYVLAGGYTPTVDLFEDMDLGQRISVMRGREVGSAFLPHTGTVRWIPFEACSDGRRCLATLLEETDIYGTQPSLGSFVEATSRSRAWAPEHAAAMARFALRDGAVEAVVARRLREVQAIVADERASRVIMHVAWRELGLSYDLDAELLATRQRAFLNAARAVGEGMPSQRFSNALRRTAT